jgi:SfnB family sulfur acquisition oxidoreductase
MSATATPTTVVTSSEEAIAAAHALATSIRPGSADRDRAGRAPRGELEQLARSGLLGITVPRELGGADVPLATVTEVTRILAVGDPAIAQIPQNHYYVAESVWLNGTPEQRELFAAGLLQGKRFGNALVERGTPTIMQINARLAPDPAGGYRLTARKYYATGALTAQWVPVGVLDADENWCFAIVDRDAPGVEALEDWTSFGQRSTVSGSVVLTDVHVPEERVLPHWRTHLQPSYFGAFGQIVHAAIDVGIAQAALEDGAEFVRTRTRPWFESGLDRADEEPHTVLRFGQMATRLHAAQAFLAESARLLDVARATRADADVRDARLAVAEAKAFGGEVAVAIASEIFELAGAASTDAAYDLDRHWRNARVHTLHDPNRWKYVHSGNWVLRREPPPALDILCPPRARRSSTAMSRSRSTRVLTAAFLILGLVLAVGLSACGDDDEGDSSSAAASSAAAPATSAPAATEAASTEAPATSEAAATEAAASTEEAAPSTEDAAATTEAPATSEAAASDAKPEPFASREVRVALVRQLGSGDYFEQWLDGAQAQADALGIDLVVTDARTKNDLQATNLQQAIDREDVDGIIVDHGLAETLNPIIDKAVTAGKPIVAVDVETENEAVPSIQQSDVDLGKAISTKLADDLGGEGKVAYVYVAGYAPLDRRDRGWNEVKKANPGLEQVAQFGKVSDSTASETADQARAVIAANPDLKAILAPYDEFAKGAVLAVNEAGKADQIKVYGVDISTADIGVMSEAGSPWVATQATDPRNGGKLAVRAIALKIAGEDVPASVLIPPALITQQQLTDGSIANMDQLREAIPDLDTADLLAAPWIPAAK